MATHAGNSGTNVSSTITTPAAHSMHMPVGPLEWSLYFKWLSLPHPELNIPTLLSVYPPGHLHPVTPALEAEVAKFAPNQVRRFSLFAQDDDIKFAFAELDVFKQKMESMAEVLKEEMAEVLGLDMEEVEERLGGHARRN